MELADNANSAHKALIEQRLLVSIKVQMSKIGDNSYIFLF